MDSKPSLAEALHFDIDKYLNPIIPPSQLHRLPKPISRFLGYAEKPRKDPGNLLVCFWTLVGTFVGLVAVAAVFKTSVIQKYHPPTIIASFGASAVLEYNIIASPLGQPRNAVFGHLISAIAGVAIAKLFMLHPDFESLRWVGGALATGIASSAMTLTGTVHPPGGATALLAVVDPTVSAMGWSLVPVVTLGGSLMLAVALLVNNLQRQFPFYWWSNKECGQLYRRQRQSDEEKSTEVKREGSKERVLRMENGVVDGGGRDPYANSQASSCWKTPGSSNAST